MAYTTEYEGVIFIEGDNTKATRKNEIKANLGGIGAQMKNITDVKKNLVQQVKLLGCNCVLDFTYGQKTALFAIDDVKFYGKGVAAILDKEEYERIIEEVKQR